MASYALVFGQPAVVAHLTAKPDGSKLDSVPAWKSSDETVATVTPADDGLSAEVNGVGPGTCTIGAVATAGGVALTVTGDVSVAAPVPPDATSLELS